MFLRCGLKRDRADEAERYIHAMGLRTKENFQMF